MKYNSVRVVMEGTGPDIKWVVKHFVEGIEREEIETAPNPFGFYLYPQTMSKEKATCVLLDKMIEGYDKQIEWQLELRLQLFELLFENIVKND